MTNSTTRNPGETYTAYAERLIQLERDSKPVSLDPATHPRLPGETLTAWVERLNQLQHSAPAIPPRLQDETYTAYAERVISLQAAGAAATCPANPVIPSAFAGGAYERLFHLSIGSRYGVDAKSGVMTNLSLLTAGSEALGHGLYIDQKTLSTALAAIQADGGHLRAYLTHVHGGPTRPSKNLLGDQAALDEAGNELNMAGFFSDIAIKGNKLVAGKFEFFETFKKKFPTECEQLVEMASKTPDLLGLSIESWGSRVYVGVDGAEFSTRPDNIKLANAGLPTLRVMGLFAAAFVSVPAANKGVFA